MYDNGYGYEDESGLDEDERNARDRSKDHRGPSRVPGMMVPFGNRRPGRRPRPSFDGPRREREVVIYRDPPEPQRSGVLANLTTDEIVELVGQAFAAFQPLPGAPVATGDVKLDVENLITYQGALALHAKRDEQVRLIGSFVAKLMSK